MGNYWTALQEAAASDIFRESDPTAPELIPIREEIAQRNGFLYTGKMDVNGFSSTGYSYAEEDYFQQCKATMKPYISDIMNDGQQDPYILINGFGEGYGDPDTWKHLAVTDEGKVVSVATSEGFKEGTAWLHSLYEQGLIDVEAFTQEWSTYVAKGKSGRYGVCFSWDIGNIAPSLEGWEPLPMLKADTVNLTPRHRLLHLRLPARPLRCHLRGRESRPGLRLAGPDVRTHPVPAEQLGHLWRG